MDNKLEIIRTTAKLNKQEFCKELGITYQTYQNYLNGRDISTDVAIKLNNIFNININWLLTNDGVMYNKNYTNSDDTLSIKEPQVKYESFENSLIENIKKLSPKRQEYYYYKVKADLIQDELQ